MHRPESAPPNFIEAYLGLVLNPGEMTETLFARERPPYVFSFFLVAIVSVFGPIVLQTLKYGYNLFDTTTIASLAIILGFSVLCFILIESLFLGILGLGFSPLRVSACIGYSTAPLVGALWLTYLFNYMSNGRLTLVSLLITGVSSPHDPTLEAMPWVILIAHLLMIIVFIFSLLRLGRLRWISGSLVALASLIPLYGSFLLGIFLADSINPGTVRLLLKVINSPALLTQYGGS